MDTRPTIDGYDVIKPPTWVLVVRVLQFVLALAIVALSGLIIHGFYMDAFGLAIVCCIFTWIISLYTQLSATVPGLKVLYNTWAHLALDGLMIIFWLSAMAATAATRASYIIPVTVDGCVSDGSAVNSNTCVISRRSLEKRYGGVADAGGLAAMSATAGLSALEMLLFIPTLAYVAHQFRMLRQGPSGSNGVNSAAPGAGHVEKGTGAEMQMGQGGEVQNQNYAYGNVNAAQQSHQQQQPYGQQQHPQQQQQMYQQQAQAQQMPNNQADYQSYGQ